VQKNDLFENIVTYEQQERLEQERLEQERLEQRLEQERLEQERLERERLEQARLEQEQLERQRLAQEKAELEARRSRRIWISVILCITVAVIAVVGLLLARKYRK
jgi:Mg2+/citrate symporter